MRISTATLLTLSALTAQDLAHQAMAEPLPPQSDQVPMVAVTPEADEMTVIAAHYPQASTPDFVADQQFSPTSTPAPSPVPTITEAPPIHVAAALARDSNPDPDLAPSTTALPILTSVVASPAQPNSSSAVTRSSPPYPAMAVESADRALTDLDATAIAVDSPWIAVNQALLPNQSAAAVPRSPLANASTNPTTPQLAPQPTVTVAQVNRVSQMPVFLDSTLKQRRVSVRQLRTVRVTNRTPEALLVELVGQTVPIRLNSGQTRDFRVNPRDLSLLFWDPDNAREFDPRISQRDARILQVQLFPSRYPIGSLGLYLPEPIRRNDVMRIF